MQKHQVPAYNLNAQGKCSLKSQAGIQKTSSLLERLGCGGMFNKDHDLSHAPPRDLMILFCLPVKLEAILGENLATSQQLSEGNSERPHVHEFADEARRECVFRVSCGLRCVSTTGIQRFSSYAGPTRDDVCDPDQESQGDLHLLRDV